MPQKNHVKIKMYLLMLLRAVQLKPMQQHQLYPINRLLNKMMKLVLISKVYEMFIFFLIMKIIP